MHQRVDATELAGEPLQHRTHRIQIAQIQLGDARADLAFESASRVFSLVIGGGDTCSLLCQLAAERAADGAGSAHDDHAGRLGAHTPPSITMVAPLM